LHLDLDVDLHLDLDLHWVSDLELYLDFGFGFHAEFTNSKTVTLASERYSNGLLLGLELDLNLDRDLDCSKTLIFNVFWLRIGSGQKQNGASVLVPRGANCGRFGVVPILTPLEPYSEDSLLGKTNKTCEQQSENKSETSKHKNE
jgi:hypothetical protein